MAMKRGIRVVLDDYHLALLNELKQLRNKNSVNMIKSILYPYLEEYGRKKDEASNKVYESYKGK